MQTTYKTSGVCSKQITFEVRDGKLFDVSFKDGCDGNLKGIASLVEGLSVNDVITRLDGIKCGNKSTSCPDQLAKALKGM